VHVRSSVVFFLVVVAAAGSASALRPIMLPPWFVCACFTTHFFVVGGPWNPDPRRAHLEGVNSLGWFLFVHIRLLLLCF
jgi:hypothetical protein